MKLGRPVPEAEVVATYLRGELDSSRFGAALAALLEGDDPEAGHLLETNAGLLRAAFPHEFRRIADQIRSYDFAPALLGLRAAIAGAA